MLAWTIYISFIGVAALMLLPQQFKKTARAIALVSALVGLTIALIAALQYKTAPVTGITEIKQLNWIPSLGIKYHLAADGISIVLVLLTGIAAVVGILFSWNVENRVKEFFADLRE